MEVSNAIFFQSRLVPFPLGRSRHPAPAATFLARVRPELHHLFTPPPGLTSSHFFAIFVYFFCYSLFLRTLGTGNTRESYHPHPCREFVNLFCFLACGCWSPKLNAPASSGTPSLSAMCFWVFQSSLNFFPSSAWALLQPPIFAISF